MFGAVLHCEKQQRNERSVRHLHRPHQRAKLLTHCNTPPTAPTAVLLQKAFFGKQHQMSQVFVEQVVWTHSYDPTTQIQKLRRLSSKVRCVQRLQRQCNVPFMLVTRFLLLLFLAGYIPPVHTASLEPYDAYGILKFHLIVQSRGVSTSPQSKLGCNVDISSPFPNVALAGTVRPR